MQEIHRVHLKRLVYELHSRTLTHLAVDALLDVENIRYPVHVWSTVARALFSTQNFTLGLSGRIGLDIGEIEVGFPHVFFTNHLTAEKPYAVSPVCRDYLAVRAIGEGSSMRTLVDGFSSIYEVGMQERFEGVRIERHGLPSVFIHGDVESGFVMPHDIRKVYPIDDAERFFT